LRDLVKNVLEFYGYRVLTASSGVEAQKVWTKADGAVDLLVTDMVMPDGISGKALAEKLLAQKPGLKVIYTSGYSIDLVHKNFALKQGFNFVPKPFHPVALTRAVHDCLAGKSITPSNTTLLSKDATSSEKSE
jgi:DNA-binding NtrC family response regulator